MRSPNSKLIERYSLEWTCFSTYVNYLELYKMVFDTIYEQSFWRLQFNNIRWGRNIHVTPISHSCTTITTTETEWYFFLGKHWLHFMIANQSKKSLMSIPHPDCLYYNVIRCINLAVISLYLNWTWSKKKKRQSIASMNRISQNSPCHASQQYNQWAHQNAKFLFFQTLTFIQQKIHVDTERTWFTKRKIGSRASRSKTCSPTSIDVILYNIDDSEILGHQNIIAQLRW